MTEIIRLAESEPLNLDATLGCGQAFRWRHDGSGWTGVVEGRCIFLRRRGRLLDYRGVDESFVRHYLALDLDLDRLLAAIDRDPVIGAAIDCCRGLRVLRQPLFECMLSYLCATNTNIPAVRARVEAIAATWGAPAAGDQDSRAFPSPTMLRDASENDFRACRLGYRAPFARAAVKTVCEAPSWETEIRSASHDGARAGLMAIPGIGPKAADCILLYALGHLDAFPVDVWIRRILARHYLHELGEGPITPATYEVARAYGRGSFGQHAGYAQLYLFGARHLL